MLNNKFLTEATRQIRLLSVEPLAYIAMFLFMFKRSPVDQMIQDKICLQKYRLAANYCYQLPTMEANEDIHKAKSAILSDVTRFDLYINLALTLPVIFFSLQIGPFIDQYRPAKKLLLVYSAFVFFLEGLLHMANAYFFDLDYRLIFLSQMVMALSTGPLMASTACWSYVSRVTPLAKRSLRMTILEIFVSAAPPTAIALSGNLLAMSPLLGDRELRNYSAIFFIQLGATVVFLLITLLLINEEKEKALYRKFYPELYENEETETSPKEDLPQNGKHPLRILLNVGANIREMYSTVARPRPHGIRAQILMLLVAKAICQLASYGPNTFIYQYVQRVFAWNSAQFSNYSTAGFLINICSTFVSAPILINLLRVSDMHLSLIGVHLILATNILRLVSTSETVFYASLGTTALNTLGMVGIQVYITKIMDLHEFGRILSLISVLDSAIPLVASVVFSSVFRLTISTMPNLSFLAVCIALAAGIICLYLVAVRSKRTLEAIEHDKQQKDKPNCIEDAQ